MKRLQELTRNLDLARANWPEIIAEIEHALADLSASDYAGSVGIYEQRDALLNVLNSTLNMLEPRLAEDELEHFQETRKKRYGGMIMREALVGQDICIDTLETATQREIAAGRMAADDPLRVFAVQSKSLPHPTREEMLAKAAAK